MSMNAVTSFKFIIKKIGHSRAKNNIRHSLITKLWAQKPAPDTEKENVTNETSSTRKNRANNSVGNT